MAADLESLGRDAESTDPAHGNTCSGPMWALFPIVKINCVIARRMIDVAVAMWSAATG